MHQDQTVQSIGLHINIQSEPIRSTRQTEFKDFLRNRCSAIRGCRMLWLNVKVMYPHLRIRLRPIVWRASTLGWFDSSVEQKPVKSNVPIYRICLNIERRGSETSFEARAMLGPGAAEQRQAFIRISHPLSSFYKTSVILKLI